MLSDHDTSDRGGLTGEPVFLADPRRDATASLHVLYDQFLFEWGPNDARRQMWVSPQAVEEAFSGAGFDTGWIAPGVLRWGRGLSGEWVVAYRPPELCQITLVGDRMPSGPVRVPLPGLVLFGLGTAWHVWAVKSRGRFDPRAKAYTVPTPNVGAGGAICFGENTPPVATAASVPAAWSAFLETPFNDHDVVGRCKSEPDDVRALLLSLARSRAKTFPGEELLGGEHTVEAHVASLAETR